MLCFGFVLSAEAVYTNDLNSPASTNQFLLRGSAVWRASGSYDSGGYISLTDAIESQLGTVVVPDINEGAANVSAFTFHAKVRIGGGTARPGDGMSISFVDENWVFENSFATEEGTSNGLSVSFDTWDNGDGDGPAIDIKVDGVIVAHKRFLASGPTNGSSGPYCAPVEKDATGAPISLETDANWAEVDIAVHACGTLSLTYKGQQVFADIVTGYIPRRGRWVIGARTGNATDNHWIDNLGGSVDTNSPMPRVAATMPSAPGRRDVSELSPISFVLDYSLGLTTVDPASITLILNTSDVTSGATVTNDTSAKRITITYVPTGAGYRPGTKQDAVLTYREAGGAGRAGIARNTFWVTPVPAATEWGRTLFIEAEDFNYSDGATHGQFHDFGSAAGSYDGEAARHGVDYNLAVSNPESPLYRVLNPPNGIFVSHDTNRGDANIAPDYTLGWNDPGDWYNFTRTFPNSTYKVYARFASGGLASHARLDRVTSDRAGINQTTVTLGMFDADPTGGRDTFCSVPLRDSSGAEVIVRLNGLQTLRLTTLPGNYDANYLAFVPDRGNWEPPSVVRTLPAPLSESLRDPLIQVDIVNSDTAVVPSSIHLFLGTNELQPLIIPTESGVTAQRLMTNYLPKGSTQIVTLIYQDDNVPPTRMTNAWAFRVGPLKGGGKSLFVEAEDFNYSNDGVTGGLYANFGDPDCSLTNKAGIPGIDYFQSSGQDVSAVPAYRPTTDVEAAKPGLDGLQRADRTITCSYIVGWNDPGEWQNYTREFSSLSARYDVYARVSSGGAAEAIEFARITSPPAQSNQTKQVVGEFRSPPTGNWDIFHYVPLQDSCGKPVSLLLSGVNTFRLTALPGNFDINYFVFVLADQPFLPDGLSFIRNGGLLTLSWPSGELQSSSSVTGPWTNLIGAVSPLTINDLSGTVFFRTVCP